MDKLLLRIIAVLLIPTLLTTDVCPFAGLACAPATPFTGSTGEPTDGLTPFVSQAFELPLIAERGHPLVGKRQSERIQRSAGDAQVKESTSRTASESTVKAAIYFTWNYLEIPIDGLGPDFVDDITAARSKGPLTAEGLLAVAAGAGLRMTTRQVDVLTAILNDREVPMPSLVQASILAREHHWQSRHHAPLQVSFEGMKRSEASHLFQGPDGPMLHLHSRIGGILFPLTVKGKTLELGEPWIENLPIYVPARGLLSDAIVDSFKKQAIRTIQVGEIQESLIRALSDPASAINSKPVNALGYSVTRGQENLLYMAPLDSIAWDSESELFTPDSDEEGSGISWGAVTFKKCVPGAANRGPVPAIEEARAILNSWGRRAAAWLPEGSLSNASLFKQAIQAKNQAAFSLTGLLELRAVASGKNAAGLSVMERNQSIYLDRVFKEALNHAAPESGGALILPIWRHVFAGIIFGLDFLSGRRILYDTALRRSNWLLNQLWVSAGLIPVLELLFLPGLSVLALLTASTFGLHLSDLAANLIGGGLFAAMHWRNNPPDGKSMTTAERALRFLAHWGIAALIGVWAFHGAPMVLAHLQSEGWRGLLHLSWSSWIRVSLPAVLGHAGANFAADLLGIPAFRMMVDHIDPPDAAPASTGDPNLEIKVDRVIAMAQEQNPFRASLEPFRPIIRELLREYDTFNALQQLGSQVIELGPGSHLVFLRFMRLQGINIHGVDRQFTGVESDQPYLHRVHSYHEYLKEIPADSVPWMVVRLSFTKNFVSDADLRSIARILRPGGILIIIEHAGEQSLSYSPDERAHFGFERELASNVTEGTYRTVVWRKQTVDPSTPAAPASAPAGSAASQARLPTMDDVGDLIRALRTPLKEKAPFGVADFSLTDFHDRAVEADLRPRLQLVFPGQLDAEYQLPVTLERAGGLFIQMAATKIASSPQSLETLSQELQKVREARSAAHPGSDDPERTTGTHMQDLLQGFLTEQEAELFGSLIGGKGGRGYFFHFLRAFEASRKSSILTHEAAPAQNYTPENQLLFFRHMNVVTLILALAGMVLSGQHVLARDFAVHAAEAILVVLTGISFSIARAARIQHNTLLPYDVRATTSVTESRWRWLVKDGDDKNRHVYMVGQPDISVLEDFVDGLKRMELKALRWTAFEERRHARGQAHEWVAKLGATWDSFMAAPRTWRMTDDQLRAEIIGLMTRRADSTMSTSPKLVPRRRVNGVGSAFGRFIAGLVLIVVFPVIVLAGAAVKFETPGPAIFRQSRIGYQGEPFEIRKLRTYTDDGKMMTRVGRFLRATKIDELPQLWNIVKGDMQWFGPRPHQASELMGTDYIANILAFTKPGLFSYAAITYDHERGSPVTSAMQQLDRQDIERSGFLYNTWLVIRTFAHVVAHLPANLKAPPPGAAAWDHSMAFPQAVGRQWRRWRNRRDPIAQVNDLRLRRDRVNVGGRSVEVTYEKGSWPSVRYLRVGNTVLAARTLNIPENNETIKRTTIIRFDPEQLTFGDYLVPLLALLNEQKLTGQILEDDGTATGIGLQVALGLNAARVVGVERYRDDLEKAKQTLEQLGYHGVLLEQHEWQSYEAKGDEQFILIHEDLGAWLSADETLRERICGGAPSSRMASLGLFYPQIHQTLVDRTLQDKGIRTAALSGYSGADNGPRGLAGVKEQFEQAGWNTLVARFGSTTALSGSRRPAIAGPGSATEEPRNLLAWDSFKAAIYKVYIGTGWSEAIIHGRLLTEGLSRFTWGGRRTRNWLYPDDRWRGTRARDASA